MIVVDASAVGEVLLRTTTGLAIQTRVVSPDAMAPDLIDVEVASIIRRLEATGTIDAEHASTSLEHLANLPIARIASRFLVPHSRRWWANTTAYDALYLAVAAAADRPLLTCDGRLARAKPPGVVIEYASTTA